MKIVRTILVTAVGISLGCFAGHYVVTRHGDLLPLWFARCVLPQKQYYVLKTARAANDLPRVQQQLWQMYARTRQQGVEPTPRDQLQLRGLLDGVQLATAHSEEADQLEVRLQALFVGAEIDRERYDQEFQQVLTRIESQSHAPDYLVVQAELLGFIHAYDFRQPPTEEMFQDLQAYARRNLHNTWGYDVLIHVAEQLRHYGHAAAAERIVNLARQCYPASAQRYRVPVSRTR